MEYTHKSLLIAATLCMTSLLCSLQAFAGGRQGHSDIQVELISDHRGHLRKHHVQAPDHSGLRSYVVARDNERYTIRVHNNSNERVGFVIAVDGRNILSGKKSHLRTNEKMYVLGPNTSADYSGWRTSRNGVNRFFFTHMDNSYSAAWGDYSAMGIIAIAAFPEQYLRRHDQYHTGKKRIVKKSGKARRSGNSTGTGFGEEQWSPSRNIHFIPQQHPIAQEFIKYEYRSSLCQRGIIQCRPEKDTYTEFAPYPDQIWKRFGLFLSF
jgi:hypothetical protein